MRRTVLTALAITTSTLALVAPAAAMPIDGPPGAHRAKLACYAGLVGAEADKHVRYDTLKNGKVTDSVRSKAKLGFPVTAWGYFDSKLTKSGGRVLQLDAIAKNGVPRQVTITQEKSGKITGLRSTSRSPSAVSSPTCSARAMASTRTRSYAASSSGGPSTGPGTASLST